MPASLRCVSVVNVPSGGGYAYRAAAEYEARPRADGVVTWRKVRQLGPDFRGVPLVIGYAQAWAAQLGVPLLLGVKHGARAAGVAS